MGSRILAISNYGEVVGGGEVSLLTLLKGMDRASWEPIVAVPSEGGVAKACRAMGIAVHVVPLPSLYRIGPSMLRSLCRLRRLILETGSVLVHANGSRPMFYGGIAGRLTGRPVVWHVRILEPDAKLDWLLARLAAKILAISEPVRERFRPWPEAHDRCVVVPNGLDLEAFVQAKDRAAVRESLGIGPRNFVVGSVGRLVPFKGFTYLLEAFGRLRPSHSDMVLLLVGDGPERRALAEQAERLGIEEAVKFLGHRDDLPDLLAAMDVFVLPSVAEHFGRVLLEAMALKLPIVATDAGGVPEIVEADVTGLLVPPEDPDALARAVARLRSDPVRAESLGAAGRRRVEARYDFRTHARTVEAVYAEVSAKAGTRSAQGVSS